MENLGYVRKFDCVWFWLYSFKSFSDLSRDLNMLMTTGKLRRN